MSEHENTNHYEESVNHGSYAQLPPSVLKSVAEVVDAVAANHAKELRILRLSSICVIEREGPRYLVKGEALKGYIVPANAVKILVEFDDYEGEPYFMGKECAGMGVAEIGRACKEMFEKQYAQRG